MQREEGAPNGQNATFIQSSRHPFAVGRAWKPRRSRVLPDSEPAELQMQQPTLRLLMTSVGIWQACEAHPTGVGQDDTVGEAI